MIRYAADEAVDRAPCLTGPLFLEATKKTLPGFFAAELPSE